MTRACLLWVALVAALGSALCVAESAQAQICTDYYRFGPIYSNYSPFADGCMEAYGEEQTTSTETICPEAEQAQTDLSGRAVVAALADPVSVVERADTANAPTEDVQNDSADCNAESIAQAEITDSAANEQAPEASSAADSQSPHYGAYEDYYGYDYYRHGCPSYVAPTVTDTDNRTEPTHTVPVENCPNEYYLKYGYAQYIDSHDAASSVQDEPAEELVEAHTTVDPWDKGDVGHDYHYSAEYSNPCIPEVDACHEQEEQQVAGDPVSTVTADASATDEPMETDAVQPSAVADSADSPCTHYEATCHRDYEFDELSRAQVAAESTVESSDLEMVREFDYENAPYGYCEGHNEATVAEVADDDANGESASVQLASPEVASPEVASVPACPDEAYDNYYRRYRPAYYEDYPSCPEQPAAEGASQFAADDQANSSQAPEAAVASQQADDYEAYDAYGYGYDHGCYDQAPASEEESVADEVSRDVTSQVEEPAVVSQPTDDYEGYRAYRYGYDHGYYEAAPSCEVESATDEAGSHEASPSDDSAAASQQADVDQSYHAFDYGYEYESACEDADQMVAREEATAQEPAAPATEAAADYDMYDSYDYDYYQPYDESPLEQESVEPDAMPSTPATDPCESYDVYEYDNVPMQSPVEAAPEGTGASSSDEQTPDIDHEYYGRYPYGHGYGYGYDAEYQNENGSDSETTDSSDEADEHVTMDVEIDFQQFADWGRESLDSIANSAFADAVRTTWSDVRDGFDALVDHVDLQQIQNDFGRALLAMLQQSSGSALESGDANVYVFEFEAGYDASTEMSIALEETPWMIEDPAVGESLNGENSAVTVEPASDVPVSAATSIDRDTLLQWAGHALEQGRTAWAALQPELERLAAETLARVPLAEEASTDQR